MLNVSKLTPSWLQVLDRYMLKEFAVNLIAITGVLWLIYVSTRFARYLAQAATGNMPAEVIWNLLAFSSLGAVSILLPIGSFLAVMITLGRMSSDSELTVMAACGFSRMRIVRNVFIFAGTTATIVAVLSLQIVPDVLSKGYEIEQKAKLSANTTGLIAGAFKESHDGDWTFYSESLSPDKKYLQNVFIEIHRNQRPLIFRADSGYFDVNSKNGDKYLILNDGYRYEGKAGDMDFTIAKFATHSLLVEKGHEDEVRAKHKLTSTAELLASGAPRDIAEVEWRAASALMTLLLCLLAIPLSNSKPRQGRYAGFVPAILIYIVYSNLLGVNKAWVAKGVVAPWLGGIWVHLLMIMLIVVLFQRSRITRYINSRITKNHY